MTDCVDEPIFCDHNTRPKANALKAHSAYFWPELFHLGVISTKQTFDAVYFVHSIFLSNSKYINRYTNEKKNNQNNNNIIYDEAMDSIAKTRYTIY